MSLQKVLYLFFLFCVVHFSLMAKEPFIAILKNVVTNDIQEFRYGTTSFTCLPYGVIAIDEIYRKADDDSVCKKSIASFYKKRVDLKYYSLIKLSIKQSYSLKRKENSRCALNIAGEKTLSEFLLDEGLAVKKPFFEDKEYNFYFHKAEQKAKQNKEGIWKTNIAKDCVAYIYTADQLEKMK